MKKWSLRILLFAVVFCAAYLGCCYLIPGWRLKLAADPLTYFVATIRSMVLLKAGISVLIAVSVTAIFAQKR